MTHSELRFNIVHLFPLPTRVYDLDANDAIEMNPAVDRKMPQYPRNHLNLTKSGDREIKLLTR